MGISNAILLKTILANSGAKKMNRDMIGFSIQKDVGSVQDQENQFFAQSLGDDYLISSGDKKSVVHPFLISKLLIPFMKEIWVHKDLNLNLLRMVHATQKIHWISPLKLGEDIRVETRITDITDTQAGELLEVTGTFFSGDKPAVTSVTGMMVRGKKKKGKRIKKEPAARTEQFRLDIPTVDGMQLTYAKASGDNNFIHTKNVMAKMAGLPRTVMHGACVLALGSSKLTRHLVNGDFNQVSEIKCRFAYPAIPGDTLTLIAYEPAKEGEIPFEILNPKGRTIIKNGVFTAIL